MSEAARPGGPEYEERSSAYRAGRRTGLALRIAGLGFFTSIAGLMLGGAFGEARWQGAIGYASLGFGALFGLFGVLSARSTFWGFITAYVLLIGAGSVLQGQHPRPKGALIAIAAGTIVTALGAMIVQLRKGRASRELDRMLFTEATSVAFFVTMLSVLSYGLLEVWIDAPRLSMWVVWTVGMGSWVVASSIFRRRYS